MFTSMKSRDSSSVRRLADKIRMVGWVNVVLSATIVYFLPNRVHAVIGACFWIATVFAITEAAAWRLLRHAERAESQRT